MEDQTIRRHTAPTLQRSINQNPIDRWMKGCILPFPKKGDLGLAKNYRGITLTSIAAKIYNALLRNRIEPKIDNILRKNQNGFRRNRSTTSQILTIRRILEGVRAKNLQATLIFVDFTVTWYPSETIEVRLILSSCWNEQWKPVKKVTVKRECGSQRGYQQVLVLSNLRSPDTGREEKREAKWLAGTPKRKWGLLLLSGSK